MPYTLTMGLLWFAAAFLVGFVTGVLVRSVVARRQVAAARAASGGTEPPPTPATAPAARPDHVRPADGADGAERAEPARVNGSASHDEGTAARLPAAESVLGHPVARDDLTVVEGLGPAVAELCHGIGIATWRELAATEASLLRTMLDDAGARYQVHDPTTWPAQAALLADGRWEDFRDLVATIRASSPGPA